MDINELSDELKAKLLECKSPAEILRVAAAEGYELNDEQLQGVAGGAWDYSCDNYVNSCPANGVC